MSDVGCRTQYSISFVFRVGGRIRNLGSGIWDPGGRAGGKHQTRRGGRRVGEEGGESKDLISLISLSYTESWLSVFILVLASKETGQTHQRLLA